MNALIIEYDSLTTLDIKKSLYDIGCTDIKVARRLTARSILRDVMETFTVIFLEWNSDKKFCREMLRFIRDQVLHKETPIIIIGAHFYPEDLLDGMDSGASSFIVTPINKDTFHHKVNMVLNR